MKLSRTMKKRDMKEKCGNIRRNSSMRKMQLHLLRNKQKRLLAKRDKLQQRQINLNLSLNLLRKYNQRKPRQRLRRHQLRTRNLLNKKRKRIRISMKKPSIKKLSPLQLQR
jgi:hypothetical protein